MLNNIEKLISTVPILQLKNILGNDVYCLLEKFNICGSVKVKTVYWILKDAQNNGILTKNKIILEASSGNTAIALAYLSNLFNLKVIIVLPKSTNECKKRLIQSYQAKLIEIDGNTDDCIIARDEIYNQNPQNYYLPDQFKNYANFYAHYNLTGPYILEKLGKIDFFCAGLGTSGTLLGTAKYLKEKLPNIKIIGVNSIEKIEGLRNFKISKTIIPFYNEYKNLIDETIDVDYKQDVFFGIKEMLAEGYFVGLSSGAIYTGLNKYLVGKKSLKGVFIAPDGGDFYLDIIMKKLDNSFFMGCK